MPPTAPMASPARCSTTYGSSVGTRSCSKRFGIPANMLPAVLPSAANYGRVTAWSCMSRRPPICGVAGDQQASLFGHCCFLPGDVKATYGTGCFIRTNTGSEPVESKSGLVTTIAATADDSVGYALEGSVFNAGSVVTWLKDEMGLVQNAEETEALAQSLQSTDGVYFVPAFTGLGAPWWDPQARGTISGLTRGSGRAHIVRAALESIAFQAADVIDAMKKDSGCNVERLAVDGGGSHNAFTMQWQANMLGMPGGSVGDERGHGPGRRLPGGALCGGLGEPRSCGRSRGLGRASSRLWRRRNVCGA